ncbi:MAG TPA: hypothetical protein VHV26_07340 [Rhizomicrobium sp.]|jgi:hypothetical protein|nr:hypothetical protein [Rhizomicrobium sp.]
MSIEMRRFFFDFREGTQVCPDLDGNEFTSAEQAYLEAIKAAQEMWGGLLAERRDPRQCAFHIRDSEKNLLFIVSFMELLESCRRSVDVPVPISPTHQAIVNVQHAKRMKEEISREITAARVGLREAFGLISTI